MTVSLQPGHDVGYMTGAVATGRENYYTGAVAAGEPPGLWYGAGAAELGLTGEVDADLIEAVFHHLRDPRDPATHSRATWGQAASLSAGHRAYRTPEELYAGLLGKEPDAGPERRAELRVEAETKARQAVAFMDATFSAPKSVSVLGAAFERVEVEARARGEVEVADAWARHHRAVEDAVLVGARAAVDYLQEAAGYARVGKHGSGQGRWSDSHKFVVAQFLQHDSRDRDPQLHVHNAVLNRQLCEDGKWRALDGAAFYLHCPAAAAVGERAMEAHLTKTLGVRFETRPDGLAREIVGVRQDVMDLFSSRSRAIAPRVKELVGAYRERYGREPTPYEVGQIKQQATLATRSAKSHDGETLEERLDRWERQARATVGASLTSVAHDVLGARQAADPPATLSPLDVTARALATVASRKGTWTRADLMRAVSDALPGHLDIHPDRVWPLLDRLTDEALGSAIRVTPEVDLSSRPAEYRLAGGGDVYARPGAERFTAPGQIRAEQELRAAAVARGAVALTSGEADAVICRYAENGVELGADQAAALRGVLTSGARVEVLSAAAGTGKSFVVGAIAESWAGQGHRAFGLAPSQVAADVLTDEGVTAANTTRWLGTQTRLEEGRGRDDDESWRLRAGDIVVVDEAGMSSTQDLAAISARCSAADAKLLLVGDPRQLGAVGPGGALADVGERAARYELAEVRRFSAGWEREASLRLRDGDAPVLDTYARHGRVVDAGTVEQAQAAGLRAWLADTLAGRDALLVVGSNEEAARVSGQARAELVRLGRLDEGGVLLGRDGNTAGVGDVVQARRNGWELAGVDGNTRAPINRSTYRVTGVDVDGGLQVAPMIGRVGGEEVLGEPMRLPAGYVAEHLTLGYASTVHAAQGRTVDTCHAVVGSGMTRSRDVYVALTRGRDGNTAWVVTQKVADDLPTGAARDVEPRTARAVLEDMLARDDADLSALMEIDEARVAHRSTWRNAGQLIDGITRSRAGHTSGVLDRLAATGVLTEGQRQALAADEGMAAVEQVLRAAELAGRDREEVLTLALAGRSLDGARSPAQVLHHRLTETADLDLAGEVASFADLVPADTPERYRVWFDELAGAADDRRRELGARAAEDLPQWAVEALGLPPEDPLERAGWEHRVGWAAAYREMAGHTDEVSPLGAAPPAGLAEHAAVWRTAHTALALPDTGAGEGAMTDGQLRARSAAWDREQVWAPRYVGDELGAASREAAAARANAELWEARALAEEALAERARAQDLDGRVAALEEADRVRASWYAHTAVTREAAERARAELKLRGVDLDAEERVTAGEWLAVHEEATVAEDPHRPVDRTTDTDQDGEDQALASADVGGPVVETAVPDIREVAVADPSESADPEPLARVLSVDETAEAVGRAQQALLELRSREEADAAHARDEEAARPAGWDREERDSGEVSVGEVLVDVD